MGALQRRMPHLRRLIAKMFDLARIATGTARLDIARLDFCVVIREAVEERRMQFEARQRSVSVVCPASPIAIDVDPERIRQIVFNLLDCAYKLTPMAGRVEIVVSIRKQQACLQVCNRTNRVLKDKQDMRDTLFEHCTAGHLYPSRSGGQGWRLALVRRLAQSSGGTFTVLRDRLGYDKCFTLLLPLPTSTALNATP
jgi:signal transduction histidine kinase